MYRRSFIERSVYPYNIYTFLIPHVHRCTVYTHVPTTAALYHFNPIFSCARVLLSAMPRPFSRADVRSIHIGMHRPKHVHISTPNPANRRMHDTTSIFAKNTFQCRRHTRRHITAEDPRRCQSRMRIFAPLR